MDFLDYRYASLYPEASALLKSINENYDEDVPRLMFADWMEEHGGVYGAIRARFIKEQVHARSSSVTLQLSEESLLHSTGSINVEFRRGFPFRYKDLRDTLFADTTTNQWIPKDQLIMILYQDLPTIRSITFSDLEPMKEHASISQLKTSYCHHMRISYDLTGDFYPPDLFKIMWRNATSKERRSTLRLNANTGRYARAWIEYPHPEEAVDAQGKAVYKFVTNYILRISKLNSSKKRSKRKT